ncbi:hypothetical protein FACS1894188_03070 [Clostridia bacterium]|nr:hypothetical protein FACS1894188_03070 [Clostridia bacterium]
MWYNLNVAEFIVMFWAKIMTHTAQCAARFPLKPTKSTTKGGANKNGEPKNTYQSEGIRP